MMNAPYALGLGVGILVGLLVYAIYRLANKGCGSRREYDERQLAAQGKAARAAMFAHLIYAAVAILCHSAAGLHFVDLSGAMMLGICISVGVFAVSCIWNDAYFSASKSPRASLFAFGAIALIQITNAWRHVADEGWFPNDGAMDSIVVMAIGCAGLMLLVIVTALVKFAAEKREEARDEES